MNINYHEMQLSQNVTNKRASVLFYAKKRT